MKRLFLLLFILATVPAAAQAQTPQSTIAWDYQAVTLAVVGTYTQTVTVDAATIATPPTCRQAGADVTCTVPVGTLAAGRHNIAVTATLGSVSATTTINGLDLGSTAPKNPTNFRYQINITVNVP